VNVRQFFLATLRRFNLECPIEDFENIEELVRTLPNATELDHEIIIYVIRQLADLNKISFEGLPDETPKNPVILRDLVLNFLVCMLEFHQAHCDQCTREETANNCFIVFVKGYATVASVQSKVIVINSPQELNTIIDKIASQITGAVKDDEEETESGENVTGLSDITNNPQAILDAGGYKVSDN
jgi:hypothetical protein